VFGAALRARSQQGSLALLLFALLLEAQMPDCSAEHFALAARINVVLVFNSALRARPQQGSLSLLLLALLLEAQMLPDCSAD